MRSSKSTKLITFERATVDYLVVDSLPIYAPSKEILKPIRIDPDGQPSVILENRLYPLCLTSDDRLCVNLNGHSFDKASGVMPSLPVRAELEYLEPPLEASESDELGWRVERDQFGVYIYINANDAIVETLVSHLINERRLNVLAWGESSNKNFEWYVRLSPGLSIETVKTAILILAESMREVGTPDPKISESEIRIGELQRTVENLKSQHGAELSETSNELISVYDELSKALDTIDELKQQLESERNARVEKSSKVQHLKRGKTEKMLARIMFHCFRKLAFAPESVDTISKRFPESSSLWEYLSLLDSGTELPLEKLNGLAGKSGWYEVRKHINTGNDKRGRLYCRRSTKDHSFDVVIHWKQDNKDQERVFRKLAGYNYFDNREAILH